MKKGFLILFIIVYHLGIAQENQLMQRLSDFYCSEVKELAIAPLSIRYATNLSGIKDVKSIKKQQDFFSQTKQKLEKITRSKLSKNLQLEYDLMLYETHLNLQRIQLETEWKKLQLDFIPSKGLYHIPMGKKWYAYFLKKWTSDDVSPDEIFKFGLKEIKKVKQKIKEIQVASKKDSISFYRDLSEDHFFYKDSTQIEALIHKTRKIVEKNYGKLFPFSDSISEVKVKRSKLLRLKIAPAYYSNSTFYYTLFDLPFNKRLVDIFFLHEGLPGHHYQTMVANFATKSEVQKLDRYNGYREGWAAYVEEMGKELGVYTTIYDALGKWEWDIVRSVRVCLDVGINYYGWSDEKVISFWKSHIPNQDEIMQREITRMKLQPAQVVTYKYGAHQIMKWKEKEQLKKGYNDLEFHTKVLERGALPFALLKKEFKNK